MACQEGKEETVIVEAHYKCLGIGDKKGVNEPHNITWKFIGVPIHKEVTYCLHHVMALLISPEETKKSES